jgi:hypothetical protein
MPFWRTRLKRGYRLKDDSDSVRARFPALLVSLVLIALLLWWLL